MAEISDLTRTVRTKVTECGCGCWVWTGALNTGRYATVKMRGKQVAVHRYVYETLVAPLVGDDITIDHLCDRHRSCVNPDHMEPVSRSVNSIRANERRWYLTSDTSRCTVGINHPPEHPTESPSP